MKDRRKAEESSALLAENGNLRLSSDLVPEDSKEKRISFMVTPFPEKKSLVIKIAKPGENGNGVKRRAMWSNKASKCPLIAVRFVLRCIGVPLPTKKSKQYKVKRGRNGKLIVKF